MPMKQEADEVPLEDVAPDKHGASKDIVRLKSGDRLRLHVLTERWLRFGSFFCEKLGHSLSVPYGTPVEGYKVKTRYAATVWLIAEKKQAVVVVSEQVAQKLRAIKDENGGLDKLDITLTRQGNGKNDTRYDAIPSPTKYKGEAANEELLNIRKILPYCSTEDLVAAVTGVGDAKPEDKVEDAPF